MKSIDGKSKNKDLIANEKAKEILWSYVKKFSNWITYGLILSLFSMVDGFMTPLYIGWIVDAIKNDQYEEVSTLLISWMVIVSIGAIFAGI